MNDMGDLPFVQRDLSQTTQRSKVIAHSVNGASENVFGSPPLVELEISLAETRQ